MSKHLVVLGFLGGALAISATGSADAAYILLLDRQGGSPNRVTIYTDPFVMDRTPITMDLDDIEPIKQINMTMVFEAVDQPHWTQMVLQFRCPKYSIEYRKPKKKSAAAPPTVAAPSVVAFRMESGSTRPKNSPGIAQLNPTGWQTSTSQTMRRAYLLACNGVAVDRIVTTSYDAAGEFDPAQFDDRMAQVGLDGTALLPGRLFLGSLAQFTWVKIWPDVQMPPINDGRPMTPEEIAEFDSWLAKTQADLGRKKVEVMASLERMDQEFKFRDESARLRGGRKTSATEAQMLMAWQGKAERDVVVAMGAPQMTEAGGVRFLAYGQDYDSRYLVQRVVSGQSWVEGVYKSCNVQFVLIPDAQAQFRVADVVISKFRSGDGWAPDLCGEMVRAPRG